MIMLTLASRLVTPTYLLGRSSCRLLKACRSMHYVQGQWPEPITQQTLDEFLQDVNYFQDPKAHENIGIEVNRGRWMSNQAKQATAPLPPPNDLQETKVDELLGILGQEVELPELNIDDTLASPDQIANLALHHGIYRDLFDTFVPKTDYVQFTPEQGERLNKMIAHYWITDLPFSRVRRHAEVARKLKYFEPVVNVFARFIHENDGPEVGHRAHTAFHGNIIPASEALVKPSITLDGRWLQDNPYSTNLTKLSQIDFWAPGNIYGTNFVDNSDKHFFSVILLNLDSLHPDTPNLHWFAANIAMNNSTSNGKLDYQELCDYLPVHGIRGFGHSRYVFLALRHDSKLDQNTLQIKDFSLKSRKFNLASFIDQNKDKNMKPVGVSWFQTVWDPSSNKIFHDYMNTKAPVYDMITPRQEPLATNSVPYPGKLPFNIFLDHTRERKDIDQQVLLERLKTVDPYDYKDQYKAPRVPETVFEDDDKVPSWMRNVLMKKKLKVGYWRGLRPASATLPLNNNADLDSPVRPFMPAFVEIPRHHNRYEGRPLKKLIKDLPYSKPANEHSSVQIHKGNEIFLDSVREIARGADKSEEKMGAKEKSV